MRKHFTEARVDALAALAGQPLDVLAKRCCLIVDTRGLMRVLAEPAPGQNAEALRNAVASRVAPAAAAFWGGDVWLDRPKAPSEERAIYRAAWAHAMADPPGQQHTFVLNRTLGKDAWLGVALEPPWPGDPEGPPIVSFYSYKGGVGRTTALAAVAANLARAGKRVAVVDLDLEAPGASAIAPPSSAPPPAVGVVDYLLERSLTADPLEFGEFCYTYDDRAVLGDGEPVTVVPAGRLDGSYLDKLGRVNYGALYLDAAGTSGGSALHALLSDVRATAAPDVVLVDSRAGLHDLGGLALSGIAHLHVLLGLSSEQSWAGLTLAIKHLGAEQLLRGSPQRDCMIVHCMAPPRDSDRRTEAAAFCDRSHEVFSDVYYNMAGDTVGEWEVPDAADVDSPHFPVVLSRDERVAGYQALADVAEALCEGQWAHLAQAVATKAGVVTA